MAWLVVGAAGLGAILGIFLLTRRTPWPWLKTTVRCLLPVWLLLPAPIQVVDDRHAPAFVVVFFESLFRADGNPWPAARALLVATAVVLSLLLTSGAYRWVRRNGDKPGDGTGNEAGTVAGD